MKIEIACFNYESAVTAAENGADRIELCADFKTGGTTPDLATVVLARKNIRQPIFVMIRPRGGDFTYSDDEFLQMKKSISECKALGIDGFVFGILNPDNTVNIAQNKELVELAYPLSCTFHRAFDRVLEPISALEDVINCGFKTILTSGQEKTAIEGLDLLKELIEKANGRINILPGGGVRSSNISNLKSALNTEYYHSSAIVDTGERANAEEVRQLKIEN